MSNLNLFRLTWSHACGVYWMHCRTVTRDSADYWKRIYENDDGAEYVVACRTPRVTENMTSRAKHPATHQMRA